MSRSREGEPKQSPQIMESVPEAVGVELRASPGDWCQHVHTEPEAEKQQVVLARFSGASCHVPEQCAAAHRPYRWEGEQGSHERSGSPLSCTCRPRNAYTSLSR